MTRIYLDHNATTPMHPEVVQDMLVCFETKYGNPSSVHTDGRDARKLLEAARSQVAGLLSTDPAEVIFTGSATEANNTVIAHMHEISGKDMAFISSTIEHPSVDEPLASVAKSGREVIKVGVDRNGLVNLDTLETALRGRVALLSLVWANNETGVIQSVAEISRLCSEYGVLLHLDATQAAGKIPINLRALNVEFASVSAHKFNGPKGAGALIVASPKSLTPWIQGGPQEARRRGGTENIAGIVGMGRAAEVASRELDARVRKYGELRDQLWLGIKESIPSVERNGSCRSCLPNTLNVEFKRTPGDVILQALDLEGISVSAGAACSSGSVAPSHVLSAMGLTSDEARSSLRFSVGQGNDTKDIVRTLTVLKSVVSRIRETNLS